MVDAIGGPYDKIWDWILDWIFNQVTQVQGRKNIKEVHTKNQIYNLTAQET